VMLICVSVPIQKVGSSGQACSAKMRQGADCSRVADQTRPDSGTMRDTVIFAAFLLLLILAVVLLARFIVS